MGGQADNSKKPESPRVVISTKQRKSGSELQPKSVQIMNTTNGAGFAFSANTNDPIYQQFKRGTRRVG